MAKKTTATAQAPAPTAAPTEKKKKAAAPAAPVAQAAPAPAPEQRPELRVEEAAPEEEFTPIPMDVTAAKKKGVKGQTVWPTSALYIDRSVEQGGFGSFAADGREDMGFDAALTKSLLRHYSTDNKGRVYQMIAPVKATVCGDDQKVLLVVLNGRQRITNIDYINALLERLYKMWREDFGGDKVRLKNALIAMAGAAGNGNGDQSLAWMDAEDVELLVGGRVNNETVSGLLTKSKESDDGPMPYHARVEYVDVDPNTPEALQISLAERISVPTPPTVQARQIQRLLKSGLSSDTIAASVGVDKKTVHNRLLVLHCIPEVQAAVDGKDPRGKVSFNVLKQEFFTDTKRGGVVAKSPEVQRSILDALLGAGAGAGKKGAAIREQMTGAPLPVQIVQTPGAGGAAPVVQAAPASPGASAPASTPAPVVQAAPAGRPAQTVGVVRFLPRAATTMSLRFVNSLPDPDPDMGSDGYYAALAAKEQAKAAVAVMAFLGGDGTALDSFPDLREAITKHIAEAEADAETVTPDFDDARQAPVARAPKKANLSTEQKLAGATITLFSDWGAADPDSRPAWPTTEDPAVRTVLGKIQAAHAAASAEGTSPDVEDFAREWVLRNVLGETISA